jgi:hypothetical protein
MVGLYKAVLADEAEWIGRSEPAKARARFADEGFHHTYDSEGLQTRLLDTMKHLDFRAHVAYSSDSSIGVIDRLVAMYYALVRGIVLRYRDHRVVFVFEELTQLNSTYSGIVEQVIVDCRQVDGVNVSAEVRLGHKGDPVLALADYVMAVADEALSPSAPRYKRVRFDALEGQFAHLLDYDHLIHRKGPRALRLL